MIVPFIFVRLNLNPCSLPWIQTSQSRLRFRWTVAYSKACTTGTNPVKRRSRKMKSQKLLGVSDLRHIDQNATLCHTYSLILNLPCPYISCRCSDSIHLKAKGSIHPKSATTDFCLTCCFKLVAAKLQNASQNPCGGQVWSLSNKE